MEKCTNFINKVRESRFTKVRDRQVNKFNRLIGKDKDQDITAQSLANSTQLPFQNNTYKWAINFIRPVPGQETLFTKGPNYAVAPKHSPI